MGHVRIFDWDGNDWSQVGSEIEGGFDMGSQTVTLALDMSSDGKFVALGEPLNENSDTANGGAIGGRVSVYEDVDGVWTLFDTTLNTGRPTKNDMYYGRCVALSGDGSNITTTLIQMENSKVLFKHMKRKFHIYV